MTEEYAEELCKTFFLVRKDKRYRAGFLQAMRICGHITQRQWLELAVEYTDYKNYAVEDHRLKQIGE